MARARPGPTGHPPAPPSWLKDAQLPVVEYPAGAAWSRCHRTAINPILFGPLPGSPPLHRFDAPNGEFRVLYLGLSYETAIVETLLRNPRRRIIDFVDLEIRSMATLINAQPLRLVAAHGAGLAKLGTTAALSTGPYRFSRRWSLELWTHKDRPDGILYASRHNPELISAAIFDRSHARFAATTAPLLADEAQLAAVLRRHGKSVA